MITRQFATVALTTLALTSVSALHEAQACGGCFAPPGAIQTVTAHRMVLSVSRTQTTLWDQFRYSGRPSEFSWILPIHYGPAVQVRLAADGFMTVLDNVSAPVLNPPPRPSRYCPGPYDREFSAGRADAAVASDAPGVTVYREEVVGPYEVVIVGGEDPMAIRDWLGMRGFSVPPAIEPIIDHYTSQHSDYVALRLRPGEGIDRMSPVRITMPGAAPMLPLRMIAAGVGDKVQLQLFVIAESRMEASNFPNGEIANTDLTYDFNAPTLPARDFQNAFDRLNASNGGQIWLTESSMGQDRDNLVSLAQRIGGFGVPRDAGPCTGEDAGESDGSADAGIRSCAPPPEAADDMRIAFEGLGTRAILTRLRADFEGRRLDQDLSLAASTAAARDRLYEYGNVLNRPADPPACNSYDSYVGDAGSSRDGGWYTGGGGCAARCTVTRTPTSGFAFGGSVAVVAIALGARRRRRQR